MGRIKRFIDNEESCLKDEQGNSYRTVDVHLEDGSKDTYLVSMNQSDYYLNDPDHRQLGCAYIRAFQNGEMVIAVEETSKKTLDVVAEALVNEEQVSRQKNARYG